MHDQIHARQVREVPSAYHEARNASFGVSALNEAVRGSSIADFKGRLGCPGWALHDPVLLTRKALNAFLLYVPPFVDWRSALITAAPSTTAHLNSRYDKIRMVS